MKTPRIANAMGLIDEDLICEADDVPKRKKSPWLKWGALAACFAVLLIAVFVPRDGDVPTGDELYLEKYYDYAVTAGTFSEYIHGEVIGADQIGAKIEGVTVTAGWKNQAGQWLSTEQLTAEVYEIRGVGRNVRVALKFIDQGEAVTTTHYYQLFHPNAEYNGMTLPDYRAENPVRYLEESSLGKSNGWQDLGLNGEVRTITVPLMSSYIYQMYSYYIRNDLRHLYEGVALPTTLDELPQWLSDTAAKGRRAFWYSMAYRLPTNVTVGSTTELFSENGQMRFLATEYTLTLRDGAVEKQEHWIIYFMEEDGVYSALAVQANENFAAVKSYTQSIIASYQTK